MPEIQHTAQRSSAVLCQQWPCLAGRGACAGAVALPSCRCAPALPAENMADTGEGVPPETAAQKKAQIAAILSNRAARVEGDGEGAASCPEPEAAPRVRVRTAMFVIGKDGKPLSGMQLRAWEAKRAKQAAAAPLPPALRV
eukprot:COSAG01_NODE_33932_length_556_cov_0.884026_1_plen_140_part_10